MRKEITVLLAVFLAGTALVLLTVKDYGLTWDEPIYIEHSGRIAQWFGKLVTWDSPFSHENFQYHWDYDRLHNCHPPFIKLAGLLVGNVVGRPLFDNVVYRYRAATAVWSGLLLCLLARHLLRAHGSVPVAVFGSFLFLAIPRFFAHTHFYATDIAVAALGFAVIHLYASARDRWRKALFAAPLAGALLATKFTGVLVFPVVAVGILRVRDRRDFIKVFALFFCLSWVFFVLFDCHAWFGLVKELRFYFSSAVGRFDFTRISTAYFGRVYSTSLPWHHPFVMFAMVLPVAVVVALIVGLGAGLRRPRDESRFAEVVPFLVLMAVFALPQTPKHDGIRLFSMVWPFMVLLAVRGIRVLAEAAAGLAGRLASDRSVGSLDGGRLAVLLTPTLLLMCCAVSLVGLVRYHPYELSYYNHLTGGAGGAQQRGFTVSYWYEALNEEMFDSMDRVAAGAAIRVYSVPNPQMLELNRNLGLGRKNVLQADTIDESDYILVLNRMLTPALCELIENNRPVVLVSRDEGLILGLFENTARHTDSPTD